MIKLLGSTKSKITKDGNDENVSQLEITKVHCNVVNNDYQHDSIVYCVFIPNKSFGQLLGTSPKNLIFLKTFNSEHLYIEVWVIDKNLKLLDIEDKININ